jgi:hypothetical protein
MLPLDRLRGEDSSDLALDVYYHPFAYRDFRTVVDEDSRLPGVVR